MDTKLKGDLGVLAVINVAIKAGIMVSLPFGDRAPYDLIFEKDGICKRIQVKSRMPKDGVVMIKRVNRTSSSVVYSKDNIDAFAIYCPKTDATAFINITEVDMVNDFCIRFEDAKVRHKNCKYAQCYVNPLRVFNSAIVDVYVPNISKLQRPDRRHTRKVKRPTKAELEKMIWEKPTTAIAMQFGVSDKAVEKWCKSYGVAKPARGYWAKKNRA